MKTKMMMLLVAAAGAGAFAANDTRGSFMRQQAFAEMQRISGQVDVLQSNVEELMRRVAALERKDNSVLRAEIDSLNAAVEELRRELRQQRGEIVKDLSSRIGKVMNSSASASASGGKKKAAYDGPCREYTVVSGDTLTLISQAFSVPISKIKEMNSLKSDNLRVGQKLYLPK
jgi:TolA-binding protein